jgi:hypothetical protein
MYLAIKVEQDFNIRDFIKSIKPTLHATSAGMISKGKDFATIVSCGAYFIFYTKDEFLQDYRNENKFIIKIKKERVKDFLLKKNEKLNKEELLDSFLFNQLFLIKGLISNGLFEEYKITSINENKVIFKEFHQENEYSEKVDLNFLVDNVSEYSNLYKIFDQIGLSKECLETTKDYNQRILELAKEIASIKYNVDDYEFIITDGNLEEKNLYYVVYWINKEDYEKKDKFKCISEENGNYFQIELSKYTEFDYLIKTKDFDINEYLYSLYLSYLYTRNLERFSF